MQNHTNPEQGDTKQDVQDLLNASLIFARALGLIFKEGEGIVVDIKGDVKLKDETNKVIVFQHKDQIHKWWEKRSFRYFINLCLTVNVVTLVIASTKPVNPSVNFYSYLWDQKAITKIYAKDESPFTMLGLDIEFYKKPGFQVEIWNDTVEESGKYIFLRTGVDYFEFAKNENCEALYLAYPEWILHFNIGNWLSRSRVWSLFKCN